MDGCPGGFELLKGRLKDGCIPLGVERLNLCSDILNSTIQRDWSFSGENINMPLKVNDFVAWNCRLKLCSLESKWLACGRRRRRGRETRQYT